MHSSDQIYTAITAIALSGRVAFRKLAFRAQLLDLGQMMARHQLAAT
jgi:hypothetical protein